MTISPSAGLAAKISASDPSSPDDQRTNLDRIAKIRLELPNGSGSDVTANLDLAATLTNYLVRFGGVGPKDVLEIISGLVEEVEAGIDAPVAAPPSAPAERSGPNMQRVELKAPSGGGSLQMLGHDSAKNKSKLLGEILVRLGTVTREQLDQACKMQHASGVRLGETLVSLGATDWDGITKGLGIQKQITGSM